MATSEKVIEMSNRLKSIKSSDNPEVNHIIAGTDDIYDDNKGKKQSQINAETDATLAEHTSTINGLNSQNYVTVAATDQTTAATDVLPPTGSADTVYRVGNWDGTQYDETCYSEYSWNGSAYVHIDTKTQIGEVFDISAYHASGGTLAKYADLSAALGTNGANIPESLRKGGMSVKFVLSSDNKYVQYRLMSDSFNTTVSNWQGVDDKPTAGSDNLVKSRGVYAEISKLDKLSQEYTSSQIAIRTFENVLQGEKYKVSIDSALANHRFLVYGIVSDEDFDKLSLNMYVGDSITVTLPRNYAYIRIYNPDSVEVTLTVSKLGRVPIIERRLDGISTEITSSQESIQVPKNESLNEGDICKISIDSAPSGHRFKVYGIVSDEDYDELSSGYMYVGDSKFFVLQRNYAYIQIYNPDSVEVTATFTKYGDVSGMIEENTKNISQNTENISQNTEKTSKLDELSQEYTSSEDTIRTFENVLQGEKYKVSIDSAPSGHRFKVYGMVTPSDYDELSNGNMYVGDYIILTLLRNYAYIQIYNPDEVEVTLTVSKLGRVPIIERRLDSVSTEITSSQTAIQVTIPGDTSLNQGDICKISIDSAPENHRFKVFGMVTDSDYDELSSGYMYVGDSKMFVLQRNYKYIRLYNPDEVEVTATLTKYGDISGRIEENTMSISQNTENITELYSLVRNNPPLPLSAKIFMQVGCIGDSYTEGFQYTEGVKVLGYPNYSWPHYISHITGHKWINWGVSGSSTKSWIDERPDYNKMSEVRATKCQAYIIGLMINDASTTSSNKVDLGVIADIGTTNNTYYAYYYRLIQTFLTINPKAVVFCNTCPKSDAIYASYNQAVRDVVAYCRNNSQTNVWLVDLYTDYYNENYFKNNVFEADYVDGHYTAIGYEFMAECMVRIISNVINSNVSSFQDIEAIPYDNPVT